MPGTQISPRLPSGEDSSNPAITAIIKKLDAGDESARDELFTAAFHELRGMARSRMRNERVDHTLQATAVVNQAFIHLRNQKFANRKHFFHACGRTMRQLVIDYARRRSAKKRGGDWNRIELGVDIPGTAIHEDLVALNDVIELLAKQYPRKAKVVDLHHFAGLTVAETANLLGIAKTSVDKDWKFAKAWLRAKLAPENS